MEYVTLGKTGLKVSRVGFGGIPIQKVDEQGAQKLMKAVFDAGINFIDTARAYTVSEELIGNALEGMRDKFIIATKSMARTADAMRADIETSLNNLKTDYIDIYQIHNVTMEQLAVVCGEGGALEALREAKEQGKIGHILAQEAERLHALGILLHLTGAHAINHVPVEGAHQRLLVVSDVLVEAVERGAGAAAAGHGNSGTRLIGQLGTG